MEAEITRYAQVAAEVLAEIVAQQDFHRVPPRLHSDAFPLSVAMYHFQKFASKSFTSHAASSNACRGVFTPDRAVLIALAI